MMTLYLATDEGVIVVTNSGGRWSAEQSLGVPSVSCIAVDAGARERLFCATHGSGTWRSDNAGKHWKRVFEQVPHERVTAVTVSSAERVGPYGVVYLGTEPSAVFRSEDGGAAYHECAGLTDLPSSSQWSFPPRPETHHVRWIAADPHDRGRLYVAIEAGALVRSPDGGSSWWDRMPGGPRDTHQLITHPDVPGRLWSAAGDGFFESEDAGESWRRVEQGLGLHYCWSVAVDALDPQTVVLSAAAGPRQAHTRERAECAIYRRSGTEQWQEVQSGLPGRGNSRAPVLSASPDERGVFYMASDAGIFRSADAGATWQDLEVDWPEQHRGARANGLVAV